MYIFLKCSTLLAFILTGANAEDVDLTTRGFKPDSLRPAPLMAIPEDQNTKNSGPLGERRQIYNWSAHQASPFVLPEESGPGSPGSPIGLTLETLE